MLYPSGLSQDENTPRFNRLFEKADIIAGDFLYIKKYLPLSVEGKIIVTNSVTPKDIEMLKERGVKLLVTSTPELDGRSFRNQCDGSLSLCFDWQKAGGNYNRRI